MIGWRSNSAARAYVSPPRAIQPERIVAPVRKPVEPPIIIVRPKPLPLPELSLKAIQNAVADHYRIEPANLIGPSRSFPLAHPRQLAMYLARKLTSHSYPEIGVAFGRHHSTVLHAVEVVQDRFIDSAKLRADHDSIIEALGE